MERDYLGKALRFPFKLLNGRGEVVTDSELIKQSISRLLNTPVGTRFMLPEYGSRVRELLFEPNDNLVKDLLRVFVKEAIDKWETRVRYNKCNFYSTEDYLAIEIHYTILKSNEIDSFVFPFYRQLKY